MSKIQRWTRSGLLDFAWTPHESADKLAITPSLKTRLEKTATQFREGKAAFHALRLSWRRGLFFFGPSGAGKTAASRALARLLDWDHFSIPAHEILDAHALEHALADAVSQGQRVIVLEDVDLIVKRMETEDFFTLLDHAMERADGTFWVANSRNPEVAPKTQLVRPGRFDEAIRLERPHASLRKEILLRDFVEQFALPPPSIRSETSALEVSSVQDFSGASPDGAQVPPPFRPAPTEPLSAPSAIDELVEQTDGLSFSHFEEMRQIAASLKLERREAEFWDIARTYIQDQIIAGDRWGGLSDSTARTEERIRHVDSRVLQASLDMTDVFRNLMEKVIGDAAERARTAQNEEGNRSG